jgi:hypothetical protein
VHHDTINATKRTGLAEVVAIEFRPLGLPYQF